MTNKTTVGQLKDKIDDLILYHSKLVGRTRSIVSKRDDLNISAEIPPDQIIHIPPLPREVYEMSRLLEGFGETR